MSERIVPSIKQMQFRVNEGHRTLLEAVRDGDATAELWAQPWVKKCLATLIRWQAVEPAMHPEYGHQFYGLTDRGRELLNALAVEGENAAFGLVRDVRTWVHENRSGVRDKAWDALADLTRLRRYQLDSLFALLEAWAEDAFLDLVSENADSVHRTEEDEP